MTTWGRVSELFSWGSELSQSSCVVLYGIAAKVTRRETSPGSHCQVMRSFLAGKCYHVGKSFGCARVPDFSNVPGTRGRWDQMPSLSVPLLCWVAGRWPARAPELGGKHPAAGR